MKWNELNNKETTYKRILISERTWHFRLFLLTYTVSDKLPIFLNILDIYLLRVCFFWLIVPYCWMRDRYVKLRRKYKHARWKHMPRVEFVEVEDSRSSSKEFSDVGSK